MSPGAHHCAAFSPFVLQWQFLSYIWKPSPVCATHYSDKKTLIKHGKIWQIYLNYITVTIKMPVSEGTYRDREGDCHSHEQLFAPAVWTDDCWTFLSLSLGLTMVALYKSIRHMHNHRFLVECIQSQYVQLWCRQWQHKKKYWDAQSFLHRSKSLFLYQPGYIWHTVHEWVCSDLR